MIGFARRHVLKLAAGAAALAAASGKSLAINYPTRPVRVVVGFPPGGFTDTTTRLISAWLSEKLGQQFVAQNRPGASSNIATEFVARSAPDGYTLLQIGDGNAYNATLYDNLSFDFVRDIAPVASLVALADPAFKARLADLALDPFVSSQADFAKFIVDFTEKWGKVIRSANIKPE